MLTELTGRLPKTRPITQQRNSRPLSAICKNWLREGVESNRLIRLNGHAIQADDGHCSGICRGLGNSSCQVRWAIGLQWAVFVLDQVMRHLGQEPAQQC